MSSYHQGSNKETFQGAVQTLKDAVLLIEGVRTGRLPSVTKRLNEFERELIKPNLVYVWNETECGLKRWTDGKIWSASKASGPFLIYTELDKKSDTKPKPNGLIKQSFSLNTKQNQRFHLIAYVTGDEGTSTTSSSSSASVSTTVSPTISVSGAASGAASGTGSGTSSSSSVPTPSTHPSLSYLPLSPAIYQENILSYIYNGTQTPNPLVQMAHTVQATLPPQAPPPPPPPPPQPQPQPQPHHMVPVPHQAHPTHQAHPVHVLHPNHSPVQIHSALAAHSTHSSHRIHSGHPTHAPHPHPIHSYNKPTLHNVADAPPIRRYNESDERILQALNRNFDKE